MNVFDRQLELVSQALEDLNNPNCKLSGIIRRAIRIARLRNDYENLWWLEEEMITLEDRQARNRVKNEIKIHLTEEHFEHMQSEALKTYLNERRVRELENGSLVDKDKHCCLSIPEIEDYSESLFAQAKERVPPQGMHTLDLYYTEMAYSKDRSQLRALAGEFTAVLRRVENRVYEFLSNAEKQLLYGQLNSDIFERNRQYVDLKLQEVSPEALGQLVAAYRRLSESGPEERSHALLSCRRILKSLADSLYPPLKKDVEGPDRKVRKLTEDKYVSRLWQFVAEQVEGRASGDLLLAQISDIGNRIDRLQGLDSKGVHSTVTDFEVNQAVIQTYLLLGDILRLTDGNSAIQVEEDLQDC